MEKERWRRDSSSCCFPFPPAAFPHRYCIVPVHLYNPSRKVLHCTCTPGQHQPKLTVLAHSPWLPYSMLILSLHVNRAPESASLHFNFVGAHIPCHSVFSVVYCRVQLPTMREPNDSSNVAASNKRSRRKMNSQVA